MAIIKCPHCKKQTISTSEKCINCGKEISQYDEQSPAKKSKIKYVIPILLLIIIASAVIVFIFLNKDKSIFEFISKEITSQIEKSEITINDGENYTIQSDILNKYDSITWKSSNKTILEVNDGQIISVNVGTAKVTAEHNGDVVGEYIVTIKPIPITSIIFSSDNITLTEGDTMQLNYTVFPDNASKCTLNWQSADESIASVDNQGVVTAHKSGNTTIIISTLDNVMSTCSVTVELQSAYNRLSDDERKFVDTFMKHVNSFKNPDSIVIRNIWKWTTQNQWSVEVTATNSFGGATTDWFNLKSNGIEKSFTSWDSSYGNYDIELINEAIKEQLH